MEPGNADSTSRSLLVKGKKIRVRRGWEGLGTARDLLPLVLGFGALRHRFSVSHVLRFLSFRIELEFLGVSKVSVASLKNGKSRRPCSYNVLHSL